LKISFEITKGGGDDVDKSARAGARETPLTSQQIATVTQGAKITSDAPASAEPPSPGPVPIASEPKTDGGRPAVNDAPIRYPFPYAVNQTLTPRGESARLMPFEQLRVLADVFDIVRIAIEARKDQITQLAWDFAPRQRSRSKAPTAAEKQKIDTLRAFFAKPDRRHGWQTWIRMLLEEVLVVDALSIYKRRTKGPTGGVNGGSLYALELIDGATIKPLLDGRGFAPLPPYVAYRQIIQGRPVVGGDCTIEQLLYRPRTVRTWTPYGLSPVECVMLTVNTALNRQMFNLSYYAEGNIPEGLMSTPDGWSVDQIQQFQKYWDTLLAGNIRTRSRLRFVGPKMAESVYQFKKESFDTKFDEWLLQIVCAAFGVQPQELGFTQQINKSQGDSQENITYRRGVKPIAGYVKDILDEVIATDLGMPDFESIHTGGEAEDRKAQAEIDKIYWSIGKTSTDELRARDGEEMIGLGPIVMTNEGPVFVEQLVKDKDHNPLTSNVRDVAAPEDDLSKQNTDEAAARKKGKVDVDAGDDTGDDDDAEKAVDDAVRGEVSSFRRWCTNRVKVGKSIDASKFESDLLALDTRERIVKAIVDSGGTVAAIASTFNAVEKASTEASIKSSAQRRYRRVMKSHFSELADALSAHLHTGITATEGE
jgi:hypothetical protein